MVANRTVSLIQRLPRWFATSASEAIGRQQARQEAADRTRELDSLCGVEVRESSFDEWKDTVAAFASR